MTDIFSWSLPLGRLSGVQFRAHFFLIFFVVLRFFSSFIGEDRAPGPTAAWLLLLLICLALHELGHVVFAHVEDSETEDVQLWPLGNLIVPTGSRNWNEGYFAASGGLIASGAFALASALGLSLLGARMTLSPFGSGIDAGAPTILATGKAAIALTPVWWLGWFGFINWVLFVANLIPALPLDGGRLVRTYVARNPASFGRDGMLAAYTAHTSAALLTVIGVARLIQTRSLNDTVTLICLAVMIEAVVRHEARMIEDGGFFEDGIFGYDFSEGYTSLEGSAAKVRPRRENALIRWRRRRSEQRRLRRQAQEAAEDRRMDEILEKLHTQGKSALTDDEQRFLVRVSTKIRNRQKDRAQP